MSRILARRLVAGLLFGFVVAAGHVADAAEVQGVALESAQRQRLAAQRDRIEAQHNARELECAERFTVTACLDESRRERRGALADVKAQLAVIDGAQRARRAAARQRRIDAKVARRAQPSGAGASAPLPPSLLMPVGAAR